MAKRILSNFDFTGKDSHIALVDRAANGTKILLRKSLGETDATKRYADLMRWDSASQDMVALTESGLRVNMSLEDMLMLLTHLYPEDIETLTDSVTKAADGAELIKALELHSTQPGQIGADVFKARTERLAPVIAKLTADSGMPVLKSVAKSYAAALKSEASPETSTENQDMTTSTDNGAAPATPAADAPVPESVQKALDAQKAENETLKAELTVLKSERDARKAAEFVAKAESLKPLGLPEAGEGKDPVTEFASALRKLAEADAAAYAMVEGVLTKAVETIAKADALDEVGADGQPDTADKNAKLEAAANDLMKADSKLTKAQAITKALEIDPSLYQ